MADNSSLSNNLVPGLKFRIHGSSRELCQCSETSVQKAGAATKCAEAYACWRTSANGAASPRHKNALSEQADSHLLVLLQA
jgi:hypothetical protein